MIQYTVTMSGQVLSITTTATRRPCPSRIPLHLKQPSLLPPTPSLLPPPSHMYYQHPIITIMDMDGAADRPAHHASDVATKKE